VRIWDAKSGKLRQDFRGHEGTIYGLSFSTDGQRIVSASSDNTLLIWKLK
jgi:WD40 repeat protein